MNLRNWYERGVLFACLLCFASGAIAQSPISLTRNECVGRYDLALPGAVDVALSTRESLHGGVKDPIRFSDGQRAQHSRFIYDGGFVITHDVTRDFYEGYVAPFKKLTADTDSQDANSFGPYRIGLAGATAWIGKKSLGFVAYKAGRIYSYTDTGYPDLTDAKRHFGKISGNFSSRALYEIPTGPGVCLPYAFVADNDQDSNRQVGVTFRLIDHPDVTVLFLDAKAQSTDPKLTARQKNEFVWGYDYGTGKQIKLHGVMPYHSVTLDSREGVGTSATITRDDGSTDFGYLATVQGDPNASADTPDLLLLVERTAANAKGNPPVSVEAINEIGKAISASIRRRPSSH
ncbi:T6SS immunity protein Tli4 family protein [Paraburkholderia nemoris]|uniref:T6SS immunity protein Tli4 family protein n=1 Tax=Paraburkholderia nemoris TaxID=2793076 RepID=UPI001B062FB4|nr:T6SS immunity protein Tli4 family protein [Paraburkholderia nemoris]CAE6792679.1 hypothetical protein LMG22931_05030 [Paraburkholderia nemoris]